MQHYFIDKEHSETDFFEFNDSVLNFDLCFRSCDSIFSKNKIDDGTRSLLNAIEKKCALNGHGLDLGCGLGVIAIALIKKSLWISLSKSAEKQNTCARFWLAVGG